MKTISKNNGAPDYATHALVHTASWNVQVWCGSLAQARKSAKFYGSKFSVVEVVA
jgi:hypothetical protein